MKLYGQTLLVYAIRRLSDGSWSLDSRYWTRGNVKFVHEPAFESKNIVIKTLLNLSNPALYEIITIGDGGFEVVHPKDLLGPLQYKRYLAKLDPRDIVKMRTHEED